MVVIMDDKLNETNLIMPPVLVIIDDDASARRMVKRIVESKYRTREYESAANFYTALEQGTAGVPEAIITDFNMPNMTGGNMIQKIKELYPAFFKEVPIIGMSGLDNENAFLQAGAVAVLKKPFEQEQLTGILTQISTQYHD